MSNAEFLNAARHHRFKSLPTCRVISANKRSYSHNPNDKKSKIRRSKVLENISSFATNNDIICLQESHTPADSPFYACLPDSLLPPFSNPSSDPSLGGTDILVRKDFALSFDIEPLNVVPGHIQLLRFSPKGDSPLFNQAFSVGTGT